MLINITKKTDIDEYPYNVIDFENLHLNAPVVFFTGENGSGKSTLLRIISNLSNSIEVAKNIEYNFKGYNGFSLSWDVKLKRGYYFQSEDFYSFLDWVEKEENENRLLLESSISRHKNRQSIGAILETEMHKGNTYKMNQMVTEFKEASHGEGYIRFFVSKLRKNTLYLLDEPETPLSFQNQLTLISLIQKYAVQGSQFIICTHSPILLAYPNALIYYFSQTIEQTNYSDHPMVSAYKYFLDNPERYMRHLFEDENFE